MEAIDKERIEGMKLIEVKIREEFSSAGESVDSITWSPVYLGNYTIDVAVYGRQFNPLIVPEERVVDYPGGNGNESLDRRIREYARH